MSRYVTITSKNKVIKTPNHLKIMLKQKTPKQKYEIIDKLDGGKRTQLCESLNVATNLLKLCADKNRYEIKEIRYSEQEIR